jgi:phosphate transport system protein
MEDARTISAAIDVIFIAKSIERIGDHAKNIAEDVIYIARGRDVRHQGLAALEQEAKGR